MREAQQTSSKPREEFTDNACEDFICSICLSIPVPDAAVEATCCGNFFCLPCITVCSLSSIVHLSHYYILSYTRMYRSMFIRLVILSLIPLKSSCYDLLIYNSLVDNRRKCALIVMGASGGTHYVKRGSSASLLILMLIYSSFVFITSLI